MMYVILDVSDNPELLAFKADLPDNQESRALLSTFCEVLPLEKDVKMTCSFLTEAQYLQYSKGKLPKADSKPITKEFLQDLIAKAADRAPVHTVLQNSIKVHDPNM